jgi:hypothetical protein
VIAVGAAGIAGIIAGSIADSTGAATTSGVITAIAVIALVLVTAAAGPGAFGPAPPVDEQAAADLEDRVQQLVADGADEAEVRALVRAATRLARRT